MGVQIHAQTAGRIEGRVTSAASGNALARTIVSIDGTNLQTLTDDAGEYRFSNVPAGTLQVTARYEGFEAATATVAVVAGQAASQDYVLRLVDTGDTETVVLEAYTVREQALTAEALAINEQRVADNIKNVVAFEEFGNMGEGNPGEFLKYVTGISISFGPAIAVEAAVRGMPATGTLVMEEGNQIASSTGDRNFELTGAATGNIERIEVTKSPTADMPANSIGGTINIIGKSGFSSRKPELTYSVYYTANVLSDNPNADTLSFNRRVTNTSYASARPIQPGIDLTYKLPISKSFALTASASASKRYYDMDYDTSTWNHNKLATVSLVKNNTIQLYDKQLLSLAADWRISKTDTLRAKTQYSTEDSYTTQSSFTLNFAAAGTGGEDWAQTTGATGSVSAGSANFNFYRKTVNSSLSYIHNGDLWKIDASASHSRSGRERRDMDDGFFNTITQTNTAVSLNATGLDAFHRGYVPNVVAIKGGVPINPFDAGNIPVTQTTSTTSDITNELAALRFGIGRSLDTSFPLSFKIGGSIAESKIDMRTETRTYAIAVPGGAGSNFARNLGIINDEYSANTTWHYVQDGSPVPAYRSSASLLYGVYEQNPGWFTLNEATQYTTMVNGSKELTETITAGYLRFDARSRNDKLRVTAGVRYEHTHDVGAGPLNDLLPTYQRDANGDIVRNAQNRPVQIVAPALTIAKLQYTERGAKSDRSYEGFYPSLNATYNFTPNLLTRFAYARTIGRPSMTYVMPGITVAAPTFDPGDPTPNATITVGNPGLKPWNSHNFDLTLEYYRGRGTTIAVGVFHKDISDFFSLITTAATPELLEEYGLSSEYLNSDIRTYENFGSAKILGFEWSIRHQLAFLPQWARGVSIFANGTHLKLSGANMDDFTGFSRQNINWGVSYARAKLLAKINVAMAQEVKLNRVAESANVLPNMFRYVAPQTLVDLSLEYRFSKKLSLYASVRNALQSDKRTFLMGDFTPDYARYSVTQRAGSLVTLGLKGSF